MISFDNTENAFKAKSDKDLKKSYWLFKLIGNPSLVKFGGPLAPISLKLGFKGLIKNTIFSQFVGGENIKDCSVTIAELGKYNIGIGVGTVNIICSLIVNTGLRKGR